MESVSGAVRASNQSRDQPTIVEMKKMWFRLRFFTVFRSPATQASISSPQIPQSLFVLFSVCVFVCLLLFSFYGNSQKLFVGILFISLLDVSQQFPSVYVGRTEERRKGTGNRALRRGIKVCLEYHLVCLLHCGSCFLASIRS